MKRLALIALPMLLPAPAAAMDQPQPLPPAKASQFNLGKQKVENCAGEKFVFAWGAGAHPAKVTLCSDKGATTEQIIHMIDEAADKIEANAAIPEDRRDALVHQMREKIAELQKK